MTGHVYMSAMIWLCVGHACHECNVEIYRDLGEYLKPQKCTKAEKAYSLILSGSLVVISQRNSHITTTEHSP